MLSVYLYLHFRQSLISVAVCGFKYRLERGKVFGLNTLCLQRKILPETALPPDLATATRAMRYLCIRASGTRG